MSEQGKEKVESQVFEPCPDCGKPLVNSACGTFAVCVGGCPGPRNAVTPEQNRVAVRYARLGTLPQAVELNSMAAMTKGDFVDRRLYVLPEKDGVRGMFRRVRRKSMSLRKASREDAVLARFGDQAIELVQATKEQGEIQLMLKGL